MRRLAHWCLVLIVLAEGCSSAPPVNENGAPVNAETPLLIRLQPFDGLPQARLDHLLPAMRRVLPRVEVLPPIALPEMAFYAPRQRYRADSLLRYLHARTPAGAVTIGLTHRDISTTARGHSDWGVMGLGQLPGFACVASTFRLTQGKVDAQFYKVAVHELGHTHGLPHCPELGCIMGDQNGRNRTDAQHDFCPRCTAHLQGLGWRLTGAK